MNSLFFRTLLAFATALLILVGILTGFFIWGFQRSLAEWGLEKKAGIEESVRGFIKKQTATDLAIPSDVPLFIYSPSKDLIFSSRGYGRRRGPAAEDSSLTPIKENGEIIGYYYARGPHFRNDKANDRFLETMGRVVWLALLSSISLSLLFALFFSRSLSSPARRVAQGLDQIAHGNLKVAIPEGGAEEIALIARSANRLRNQLVKEQELRRQWSQDIAHDLRTPISALKAQFEGMRDGVLDVSPSRIERNIREISRIEQLVADLEELMRLESPEMKLSMTEIWAQGFLDEMRERFSHEIERKNISFEGRSAVSSFTADEGLIHRAVANFISNAVRHTNRNGRITASIESLAVKDGEHSIVIRVSNTGEPIPDHERERVFDRLFRGEYSRNTTGSGLGLTIARRIAELHGGTVTIKSQEKLGTRVEMVIPMQL